jgi:hypothetical protein
MRIRRSRRGVFAVCAVPTSAVAVTGVSAVGGVTLPGGLRLQTGGGGGACVLDGPVRTQVGEVELERVSSAALLPGSVNGLAVTTQTRSASEDPGGATLRTVASLRTGRIDERFMLRRLKATVLLAADGWNLTSASRVFVADGDNIQGFVVRHNGQGANRLLTVDRFGGFIWAFPFQLGVLATIDFDTETGVFRYEQGGVVQTEIIPVAQVPIRLHVFPQEYNAIASSAATADLTGSVVQLDASRLTLGTAPCTAAALPADMGPDGRVPLADRTFVRGSGLVDSAAYWVQPDPSSGRLVGLEFGAAGPLAVAYSPTYQRLAGGGTVVCGLNPDPCEGIDALQVRFNDTQGFVVDGAGRLYVSHDRRIGVVGTDGKYRRVAGGGPASHSGTQPRTAWEGSVGAIALAKSGEVLFESVERIIAVDATSVRVFATRERTHFSDRCRRRRSGVRVCCRSGTSVLRGRRAGRGRGVCDVGRGPRRRVDLGMWNEWLFPACVVQRCGRCGCGHRAVWPSEARGASRRVRVGALAELRRPELWGVAVGQLGVPADQLGHGRLDRSPCRGARFGACVPVWRGVGPRDRDHARHDWTVCAACGRVLRVRAGKRCLWGHD